MSIDDRSLSPSAGPSRGTHTVAAAPDAGTRPGSDPEGRHPAASRESVTDECRRLGELLLLDAAGVVAAEGEKRRVAWWAAPGCALPASLDSVLEGRAPG